MHKATETAMMKKMLDNNNNEADMMQWATENSYIWPKKIDKKCIVKNYNYDQRKCNRMKIAKKPTHIEWNIDRDDRKWEMILDGW